MNKNRRLVLALALAAAVLVSGAARAALIDRGVFDGVSLIYDTTQDITWVGDANLAKTSGFDADGFMTWSAANAWAGGLTIGGFTNWRLPITVQPDLSCSNQSPFSGFPDQGNGTGCTGSEMGHLFNVDGVTFASPTSTTIPLVTFTNVQSFYWSGTEFAPSPFIAWGFFFDVGVQSPDVKNNLHAAWAVRSGDVPEPATWLLLAAGLAGLGWGGRRERSRR